MESKKINLFISFSLAFLSFYFAYKVSLYQLKIISTYPILSLFLLYCLGVFTFMVSSSSKKYWEKSKKVIFIIISLTIIILFLGALFITPQMYLLYDHTNLFLTSLGLYYFKVPVIPHELIFDGNVPLWPHHVSSIRPPLFSFILSILHGIFGPHLLNASLLNLFIFLLIILYFLKKSYEKTNLIFSLGVVLLFLGQKIFLLHAFTVGFELLFLFTFLLMYISYVKFNKTPSKLHFHFFLSSVLLFSHTRYESIFIAMLLLVLLMFNQTFRKQLLSHLNLTVLNISYLFLFPIFVIYFQNLSGSIAHNPKSSLSLYHLTEHILPFIKVNLSFIHGRLLFEPLINWMNILLIIYAFYLRKVSGVKDKKMINSYDLIFVIVIGLHSSIILSEI